jgi:hypothetical protein
MFRFTIRDVLWLTALVALGVGWWLDHASSRAQLKASQAEAMKWRIDAEVYGKLLRQYPPTNIDLPQSLTPQSR